MTYLEQFHNQWQEARHRIEHAPRPVEKPSNKRTILLTPPSKLPMIVGPLKKRRGPRPWTVPELRKLWELGETKTPTQLAEIFGVSLNSIYSARLKAERHFGARKRKPSSAPKSKYCVEAWNVSQIVPMGRVLTIQEQAKQFAEHVCEKRGVSPEVVLSASRKQHVAAVRAEIAQGLAELLDWNPGKIGRFFGRDRTTVIHMLKRLKSGEYDWLLQ